MCEQPREQANLRFGRKAYVASALYFAYVLTWNALGELLGVSSREITFWIVSVTMSAACCYYVIQAFATENGRHHWLDLGLNFAQGVAVAVLIVAHLAGELALSTSLGFAAALAFAHPILTDWHHIRRWFRTDAASYVPPACLIVDFSAGALAAIAAAV